MDVCFPQVATFKYRAQTSAQAQKGAAVIRIQAPPELLLL